MVIISCQQRHHKLAPPARKPRRAFAKFFYLGLLVWQFVVGVPAAAKVTNFKSDKICRNAANYAATKTGIPESILYAISLTETGRTKDGKFAPWPWTVNMEGKGVWFDDRSTAFQFATDNFNRGARSFDVGCFQLNYRWHKQAFTSLAEMFEPNANALYAAKYLLSLFAEFGDWESAVGAYHSRTPKLASRYKKRFTRIHARLIGSDVLPKSAMVKPKAISEPQKVNRFPLLQPSLTLETSNGSLFSLSTKGRDGGLLIKGKGRLF